ncbi:MAG: ABC transporter ATP-binding protein, partial [Lachnospiraceae bacterium]|nr:ABC transporter ATP-binding protein [Lachnospiraceae bacterium]
QMSAEELHAQCRKSVRMTVDDTKILAKIMEERNIEYKIFDERNAEIYAEVPFSDLAESFAEENSTIYTMGEHEESLEAYYLSLLGGENNA